jgi:hypothetical protein
LVRLFSFPPFPFSPVLLLPLSSLHPTAIPERLTDALQVDNSAKYDRDGIDVYFMNNEDRRLENVTDSRVIADTFDAIQPFGSTPCVPPSSPAFFLPELTTRASRTGVIMDEILRDYVEQVEDARATRARVKPLLLLVITDGRADDPDLVKGALLFFFLFFNFLD